MHEQIIISLVYSIYRTIMEPERWRLILKECEELAQADVCDLASFDFNTRVGRIVAHSGTYDESFIDSYERELASANPWLRQKHRYMVDGAVWTGEDLCSEEEIIRTSFFNHWLRPQQLYHRICSSVGCEDGNAVYLSALRGKERGNFEPHDFSLLQKLIPHIRQVFELQRLLGTRKTTKRQPLLEVAQHVHDAVLLVSSDKRILGANAAGERLLSSPGLAAGSGGLWARINAAIETASGRSAELGGSFALEGDHPGHLTINIVPLPPGASPEQHQAAVAVTAREKGGGSEEGPANGGESGRRIPWRPLLIDTATMKREGLDTEATDERGPGWKNDSIYRLSPPGDKSEANMARLRDFYDLTRAEARLAVLLACGQSLQQCAANLGVSITTLRTHLQRIFSKTDTHHQGELVALLLAGPVGLEIECVRVEETYDGYA